MKETELKPYVRQDYTCENGELAQIIIPRKATKDDLCALKEMLEILIERKFKVADNEQN
jgi:hypothetical protein